MGGPRRVNKEGGGGLFFQYLASVLLGLWDQTHRLGGVKQVRSKVDSIAVSPATNRKPIVVVEAPQ